MKKLKRLTAFLLLLLWCAVLFVPAAAQSVTVSEYGLTLTLPQGYTVLTAKNANKNTELLEPLGYNAEAFAAYLTKNNIALFALSETGCQLTLKSWETDFSRQTVDFSELSDEKLESIADQLLKGQKVEYTIWRGAGPDMICVNESQKDSGGEYQSVQYIMLRNKRFFTLNLIFPGKQSQSNADLAQQVANSVTLKNNFAKGYWGFSTVLETVLIWAVIAAAGVATVLLLRSFILDRKRARREADGGEEIYIKRRKR